MVQPQSVRQVLAAVIVFGTNVDALASERRLGMFVLLGRVLMLSARRPEGGGRVQAASVM